MNAIPVINPDTVIDALHAVDTELLSIKKNTVAANIPIEITQNVIPTKSSDANKIVSAFAIVDKLTKITKARPKILSLLIKNLSIVIFCYNLNPNYNYNSIAIKVGGTLTK